MKAKEEKPLHEQDEPSKPDSSWCQTLKASTEHISQQIPQAQLQQLSPAALAYLGDAIYEFYVRMFYLLPPQRSEAYHRLVVAQVRAEKQALHLRSLMPHLQQNELEIVRRGRNAATGRPKRVDPETYQQATSLETLIGYLYLTNYQRLTELLQKLHLEK
ncbi:ribonuclease III domain-containing protein [Chlorogloeopsis sp. ULAP01]|uniref:Mini-ribonuclease 3 n=1 Tax=Chlorogloeopsis sp. ULAP01 TaxID=3056483 RepID=UPI0025AA9471|nr:ribonuclease III domain-containing protein [Chlorogloeopsis sp. ULAP01]MDM9379382.1 ribonuclease III domain-containing protein [Chlorogloeopsis sp. ULAP01]